MVLGLNINRIRFLIYILSKVFIGIDNNNNNNWLPKVTVYFKTYILFKTNPYSNSYYTYILKKIQ